MELDDISKQNCISKYIKLSFDPGVILVDTTSSILDNATFGYKTINDVSYIKEVTFPIDALSSKELKFYKLDPSLNYTYPNDGTDSIINVEILEP